MIVHLEMYGVNTDTLNSEVANGISFVILESSKLLLLCQL